MGSIKVELQFLRNHKDLYLELHREFAKNEHVPQSEAQLQNFKNLLLLEIGLLMGTIVEWATGAAPAFPAPAGGPVLEAGAANDDADMSVETPLFAAAAAAAPVPTGCFRRSASAGAKTNNNSSAPATGNADPAYANNTAAADPR